MIPLPNGAGEFNEIGGKIFDYAKDIIFVFKKIESMLYESGFGAATEMGRFTLDKVPKVSLAP